MSLTIVEPPVTVAEAKAYARVDSDGDDALIESLIGTARDHLEQATGRTFVATTQKLTLDQFADNEILLPLSPIASVESVIYYNSDGALQTLATSGYTVAIHTVVGIRKAMLLQDYVTPLSLALVGAVHVVCVGALAAVLLAAPSHFPGWRVVGPGGTHWFCFLGCWAFATLVSWVWLFVGSARRDAEVQMHYALMLIFAFGIGAAVSGFYMVRLRRMALRWRGTAIRWRERGRDIVQDMSDFDVWRRALSGLFHLRFRDGTILKLDLYARNAEEFAVALNERGDFDIL